MLGEQDEQLRRPRSAPYSSVMEQHQHGRAVLTALGMESCDIAMASVVWAVACHGAMLTDVVTHGARHRRGTRMSASPEAPGPERTIFEDPYGRLERWRFQDEGNPTAVDGVDALQRPSEPWVTTARNAAVPGGATEASYGGSARLLRIHDASVER